MVKERVKTVGQGKGKILNVVAHLYQAKHTYINVRVMP